MFSRINIGKIITAHYKTLYSLNSKGVSWRDIIIFIIAPIVISFSLIYFFDVSIKKQVGNLITALSILAGFLFNLLAIIHSSLDKIKNKITDEKSLKFIFANEIHTNISYNIIIALFLIIFLVIFAFDITIKNFFCFCIFNTIFNFICISLLIHFILTLFMILNRIYILIDKEN